ncbi:nucleotidyltransferase domain-containing protein [Nonomuraea glycinis]|uniref:nucleotidyltransferase domain-containing protein n=1 Tax=Nonomuraea glycinis TaxID=2047744 RepID=UPI0033AFE746
MTDNTPANVLLAGIVGSTAYGLAGPDSDVDRLGIFAAPTLDLAGLHRPQESIVTTGPDRTLHEAGKWCALALKGNPTVMELLWLPSDLYETRTPLGDQLIGIRDAFLSAPRVRDAYFGYATQQFHRLDRRGDGSFSADTRRRTAKHARHLARLLKQGRELYETGHLPIRLEHPEVIRDFGERVAAGDTYLARDLLAATEKAFDAAATPLPDEPARATVEEWLRQVRIIHLETRPATVFLAWGGEYDERDVQQVFTRRADADAYGCADYVEERPLQHSPVETRAWHRVWWHITGPAAPAEVFDMVNPLDDVSQEQREFDGRADALSIEWWPPGDPPHSSAWIVQFEGWDRDLIRAAWKERRDILVAARGELELPLDVAEAGSGADPA